ncbi:MAG TPA: sulfite exporter TauE/SafE family protein [Gemmatimonadaceae bacterium]|nr:sulfite exporter TauE/SafE family protein [Gemmatimonadaceae bacterium]
MTLLALALGLAVGFVLGLLGGGGSLLAVPIFLYVLQVEPKPAIAMSLVVVGLSACVGFLTHLRQGTVALRIAIPFGLCAMVGAFVTARLARFIPATLQLLLFGVFAFTAAILMLRDAAKPAPALTPVSRERPRFSPRLIPQAVGVGVLTSLIGAGGGFVIVPALALISHVPIKAAVGSSLLIITLNALAGFVGYIGQIPIDWPLVASFSTTAAIGAIVGTRFIRHVPTRRIKQAFAILILVLGTYLVLQRAFLTSHSVPPASQTPS